VDQTDATEILSSTLVNAAGSRFLTLEHEDKKLMAKKAHASLDRDLVINDLQQHLI
jgi:hypothetical protein